MRKTPLAALIASALLSLDATALDLMEAYREAQAYDSQFASARAAREANSEKSVQGRAGLLPSVNLTASANKVTGQSTLNPNIDYTANSYQLQLRQPLYNRANSDIYEQSKLQVAVSEVQFDQARSDLMIRVAQAYFDVLTAQDTIEFIQAQRTAIAEQLASAKRNFEVGTATITDTHEAQARYDLISANIIAAENNLQTSKDVLARILGQSPQQLSVLPYTVNLPAPIPNKLQEWSSQASMANLEVVRARLQTRISEQEVQIAKSGHYPTFSLIASSTSNTVGNSQVRPFYDGRTIDNTVGLQMNLPIYSGGGVSAKVTEKAELQQKSVFEMEAARRLAVQQAQQYFNGVNAGLARIKGLEAGEKSSRAALEANRTGYEVGVRINLDVLNAQQQLFVTMRDLARTRYDTLMLGMRLRANSGVLSEADLLAINSLLRLPGTPGTSILDSLQDMSKPSRETPGATGVQRTNARTSMPR